MTAIPCRCCGEPTDTAELGLMSDRVKEGESWTQRGMFEDI